MDVSGAVTASDSTGPEPAGGSIRLRIAVALIGVSVLTLLIVSLLFYGFLGNYVLEQKQQTMLDHATEVASQVETLVDLGPLSSLATARGLVAVLRLDMQVLPDGAGITIYDGDNVLAAVGPQRTRGHMAAMLLPEARMLTQEGPAATTFRLEGDQRLVVAAAPADLGTGGPGLVVVSLPTSDAIADRAGMFRILMVSGLLGVGFALVVGLGLGEWLTRPLRRLSRSARTMAAGSYAEPITGSYPIEVFDLASSLETMRREVRRSDESLRAFVASAAHELRTPLTSIQGFSQSLLDGTADSPEQRQRSAAAVFRESARLRRLVDALLTLSRYDSREFRPAAVPVDVMRLVSEEVERLVGAGMVQKDRVLVTAGSAVASTFPETDPDMLRQVVGNLLHNAVQYGADDRIDVTADVVGDTFTLDVENGGQAIGEEEGRRVFERFYRGRSGLRYEGFGLGLPLVREICEVLGGDVRLVAPSEGVTPATGATPGTGAPRRTRFRVTVPLRRAPVDTRPGVSAETRPDDLARTRAAETVADAEGGRIVEARSVAAADIPDGPDTPDAPTGDTAGDSAGGPGRGTDGIA